MGESDIGVRKQSRYDIFCCSLVISGIPLFWVIPWIWLVFGRKQPGTRVKGFTHWHAIAILILIGLGCCPPFYLQPPQESLDTIAIRWTPD
jgi:hypothetical protein